MSDPKIDARLKASWRAELKKAIRNALRAGYTVRDIAKKVGLSVGGVHKIINQTRCAT